jgi:OmpA-OmpF porin, OOP family
MRKLCVLLAIALVMQSTSFAQNRVYRNAVNARLNFLDYGQLNNEDLKMGQGFELAYFRNVAPFLNIGVPFKVGLAKLPKAVNNSTLVSFDLVARLENVHSTAKVVPYAFGGGGYSFEKDNNHVSIPFGGGLHFRVSPFGFINLQLEYRKALVDERDNVMLGIGYTYLLHEGERKPVPAPVTPKVADLDKDGVTDSLDHCPTLPGPAIALGCPDADSDGLGDAEDGCPNDPGSIETNGCPDYDKDGVADKDDECPTVAGTWNGCPDSDFDGIADKDDKCPNEAGTAANMGCPAVSDSDGDGFADDEDKCPTQAGPNQGCPDSDGDGIADNFDKCPTERGTVENEGCPAVVAVADSDGDGTPDDKDGCPTQAGTTANMGCPDADGDGVVDKNDKCPTVAGTQPDGCPPAPVAKDSDGDGLNDDQDKCPNTAGPTNNGGCPEVKQEVKEKLAVATKAVQFETGKAVLKPESYAVLDEVVGILRSYPEYALAISGHTDNIGDDERNLRLSQERAKTCYDYLVFRGIKAERLRHAGFGEARPLAENNTAAGRELNRRVEFEVIFE